MAIGKVSNSSKGANRIVAGCGALHNKAQETVAIAIIDTTIDIDIVGVLVISLLKIVDNELGLRGYLFGE
jgi:hypothetical protein